MSGYSRLESSGFPRDQPQPSVYPAAQYPASPPYPNVESFSTSGSCPTPGNVPFFNGELSPPGFKPEVCPTAPDLNQIENIPGKVTSEEEIVVPPSVPDQKPEVRNRKKFRNLPSLTEEDVRDAAIQYASEHCCYGSKPAKNMVINDITMMNAFHYKLETFAEKRKTARCYVPYNGGPIDSSAYGRAPHPWDINATPTEFFKNEDLVMEVPHTAFIKPCDQCVGNCRVRCGTCCGNGRVKCRCCRGSGKTVVVIDDLTLRSRCKTCDATGNNRCTRCDATGQVQCKSCNGKGQLKGFTELTVTWTNHVEDYISGTSNMPKKKVHEVTGQIAFEEECLRVSPILEAPVQSIRNASSKLIKKHSNAFPSERILKQRHRLRVIPIAEVNYTWKDKGELY